ncbi:Uncharacterised protein [Serratia fonticola]|uniref:hypothetical protein n=1 Tax=Serratia fonticola TaxID=47917 RepID=UPI002182A144|nr:hypothetical protein [Serratia fonticola]CAI2116745.1 Uncharacterised protein [Serratia fonticola]
MGKNNESQIAKFHQKHRTIIDKFRLQNTTLLDQLDGIALTCVPDGAYLGTKLNSIHVFFEILDTLHAWRLRALKASGVRFLLSDAEAWVELEYAIHAACPSKASGRLSAFTNIVNYANGIYIKYDVITTAKLSGNEYHLRSYSKPILNFCLFGTQLFLELRSLTASIDKNAGEKNRRSTLSHSLKAFFDILSTLSASQVSTLKSRGLRSLISDKRSWVQLEFHIYSTSQGKSPTLLIKQLGNLINYANGIYEQSKFVSTTNQCGFETPILLEAYQVSVEFFNALIGWKTEKLKNGAEHNTIRHNLIGIIRSIGHVKNSTRWKKRFSAQGLKVFDANTELSEELKSSIPQINHTSMIIILSGMGINYPDPREFRVQVKSHNIEVSLRNTQNQSKVIFNELRELAQNEAFKGIKKTTAGHYFSSFDSVGLPLLREIMSDSEFKDFCETGLGYLDRDEIYDKIDKYAKGGGKRATLSGLAILKKFLKKEVKLIKDSPYTLYFNGISRNNHIKPFSMDVLGSISERAFNEFKLKHDDIIKNMDTFPTSEISYYSQLQDFVAGLKKVLPELSQSQINKIKNNGLSSFVDNQYQISMSCLETFQSLVKSKRENARTINGYRHAFRRILSLFVGEVPDAYVIPTKRDELIEKFSYKSGKHYTEDEVRELAFYIEKALALDNTSLRDKIYLYYAKIQIKTGCNQQPLLDLSLNKLTKRINPITNQESYDLTLIKNRQTYKANKYSFTKTEPKDSVLRSVINDIIFVRDKLTSELRATWHLDNYLFIEPCKHHGARRIEALDLRRLPKLISNAGCQVHYNPQKVRRGGVNFIYKHIARSIREYESLANHNYQTFIEKYKEISKKDTVDKLSESINIMANYFSGKTIHQELQAIDNIRDIENAQEVPTGICTSTPDSDEVQRYNKLNSKIVSAENKYCGDFLACVWCKYFKVVKDADHIWKLLSYKEYIISAMECAIVDNNDPGGQKAHTEILSRRVDDIISFVGKTRPDVLEKARFLIESHGAHPDWEFAFPLSDDRR